MPNVLVVPVSGAIFFDRNAAGASTVAALNSAVRLSYDQGGGVNITSYAAALTALDRFTVDGAQGRLFSVSDALTGSLMSVNDITGLPILEVLDTDTVIAGTYNTNTFIVSGTRIAIGRTIDSTAKVAISGNTTVSGTLSTNNIITALGGNSNQWNSNWTTTNNNSATWSVAYTNLVANSANYLSGADLSLLAATSGSWNSNYATTSSLSSSWTDLGFIVPIQSNSVVLELSAFSYFLVNLNANISSMTFRNPKVAPQITSFALQLSADGTARSVAWPASIRWPGGTAPTITSTANKVDTFAFFSYDSGISYYGFATGTNS
jgi:hypothetical protein